MNVPFGPEAARALAAKAQELGRGARALSAFAESEPALAKDCAVEVQALEARAILSGGAVDRASGLGGRARALGNQGASGLAPGDLDQLGRLEAVLAVARRRVEERERALAQAEGPGGGGLVEKIGPVLGGIVVDRVIGLVKSIF
jgi:hypothetical protein